VEEAAKHHGGWEGWRADAVREKDALRHMAGAPGVVGFRELVIAPGGAIHLVMEWVPACSYVPVYTVLSV
jgi:hypothetical protein